MSDGHVEQSVALEDSYFGEGITVWGDVVVMITWKSARGFVFNKVTLEQITTFDFVTTNGQGRFSKASAPSQNMDVCVFCALRCLVLVPCFGLNL
jgi:glutamine cyclotransferase